MQTERITIDRGTARELWRKYREHLHYGTPIDREVGIAYQKLAQGKLVIKALESIVKAGINEQGFPKLAICRATAEKCWLATSRDGSARMATSLNILQKSSWRGKDLRNASRIEFPAGSFVGMPDRYRAEALVPTCPIHLRPKRGLANYHILWEAEWKKIVPVDPFLLRRLGKGDLWLVVAMWDLTEVERAALAARL